MNWTPIFRCAFLIALAARAQESPAPPVSGSDPFVRYMESQGYVARPFDFNDHYQIVGKIRVEGAEIDCWHDTGAPISYMSERTAASVGLQIRTTNEVIRGPNGQLVPGRLAVADDLAAGEIRFGQTSIMVFPATPGREYFDGALTLGRAELIQHAALIDFGRKLVFLHPDGSVPKGLRKKLRKLGYRAAPLVPLGRLLGVDTLLDETPARLGVDTGSTMIYLDKRWVEARGIPLNVSTQTLNGIALASTPVHFAAVTNVQIAGCSLRVPQLNSFEMGRIPPEEAGLIGNFALHCYGAILDLGSLHLYLPDHGAPTDCP